MKATIMGEIFPQRKSKQELRRLMRKFNACKRYAYQRLLEGKSRNELKRILPGIFNLNSRYVDDAISQAQEILASQQALGGKTKKVIFGGKRLFRSLREAKEKNNRRKQRRLQQLWRDKRSGSVYSQGDKSKEGNLNLRIRHSKGKKFFIRVNIGSRQWIEIPLFLGKKYSKQLLAILNSDHCVYSVELLRRNNRYFAHITIETENIPVKHGFGEGAIGIDLNAFPAHIAWCETDHHGNYLSSGKIMTPHLYDARANQRSWWRGEYGKQVVTLAVKKGKGIILETLDLQKCKQNAFSRKLRRILSNFSYCALKQAIVSLAHKKGCADFPVWPGFTSIIGKLKYSSLYNLSIHQAASLVIARRGLGYREKLTKELFSLANSSGLVTRELLKSTAGRNRKEPPGIPGWSVWRGLAKAVLTERSTKPLPTKERGP